MNNEGWVKFHRKLFDNKMWLSEPFTKAQAWVDLFGNVNHKAGSFWVRGNEVKIERGQLGWSELTMSKRWQWSRDKVRRFLKWLELEGNIRQQKDSRTTIITVIKYDLYQTDKTTEKQQTRQQTIHKQELYKNDKNEKKKQKLQGDVPSLDIHSFIDSFKGVNPAHERLFSNKTERASAERLIKKYGLEKMLATTAQLPVIIVKPYAPKITTPYELERDLGKLIAFVKQNENIINKDKKVAFS